MHPNFPPMVSLLLINILHKCGTFVGTDEAMWMFLLKPATAQGFALCAVHSTYCVILAT